MQLDPTVLHCMDERNLWTFSLDFYQRQGVADSCIALQDAYGADVDLILFALWCGARGHDLEAAQVTGVEAAVDGWRRSVVGPVRNARRALKPAPEQPFDQTAAEALHERLLSVEIEAERLQLLAMETFAPPPGTTEPSLAARRNLALVASVTGIPADADALAFLLRSFA